MEIERKYIPRTLPDNLLNFPSRQICQGYLSIEPVVRVRKQNDEYFLTYKGSGLMAHEEYDHPLTKESYEHLLEKCDGIIIKKTRYLLPVDGYPSLTAELDVFENSLAGLIILEVEFENREQAESFSPPSWFGKDVTLDRHYHNSCLSQGNNICS